MLMLGCAGSARRRWKCWRKWYSAGVRNCTFPRRNDIGTANIHSRWWPGL